jgi:uncharacterized membrane protein
MVVFHAMFTLYFFYDIRIPVFFEPWFDVVVSIFAGAFIFISGIVCRYSRNNLKRGVQCFFLGMGVTFVTAAAFPKATILFGILHFLGISMMLYGLVEGKADKISPRSGITAAVILYVLTRRVGAEWEWGDDGILVRTGGYILTERLWLPQRLYDSRLLFPLGFEDMWFGSGDYFPLLPWVFIFFAGTYFGVYVKAGKCPDFFYTARVRFLAAAGRRTIWIYLLHQPVIMGILYVIFGY